jgi:hypothetical protein
MPREPRDPVVLVCYTGRRLHPEEGGVAMTAPISKICWSAVNCVIGVWASWRERDWPRRLARSLSVSDFVYDDILHLRGDDLSISRE